ncbi:MAG TPA: hypothetical protein VF796_09965 [Humisphaera sp.]
MWKIVVALALSTLLPSIASAQAQRPARLDYKQVQALKDATYYIDQSDGVAQALAREAAGMRVGDATVNIGRVRGLLAHHARAAQYVTNANDRFAALPAGHPDVAGELARLKAVAASLDASGQKLRAVEAGLAGVVAQGAGDGFRADAARMKEINQMFTDVQVFRTHPGRAVDVLKQLEPAKAERQRIAATYAGLMNQPTGEAKLMREVLAYADEVIPAFEKAAAAYAADAPAAIGRDCDDVLKMAATAAADKNPAFFKDGGGIPSQLAFARTKLSVLEAASPAGDGTAKAKARLAATEAEVVRQRASLLDAIVAANQPPADAYAGADKAALVDIVKAKWAAAAVPGDVLRAGINSDSWTRDTRWEWSSGSKSFSKVDRSRAQGWVLVKSSPTVATVYYINLSKDHLTEDKVTAHYFDDPKAEPDVTRRVPMANVK